MEEVEILCDRVIILDKGKVIASGTNDELKKLASTKEKIIVEILNLDNKHIKEIKNLKNVKQVTYKDNNLTITYDKGKNNIVDLISYFKKEEITYNNIFVARPSLNDVFLELTGKELRD